MYLDKRRWTYSWWIDSTQGWPRCSGHSQLSPDFNIPTSLHWKATRQLQEQYGKPNLIFQHDIDARTMRHIQCLPFSQASHLEMQRFSIARSGRKISSWPPKKFHAVLPPTQYFVSFVCFHPSHSWDAVPIVSVKVPKRCHLVLVGRWLSAKKTEDSPLPIQSVGDDLRDPNKNPQQKFIVCLHPQYIFPISSTQKKLFSNNHIPSQSDSIPYLMDLFSPSPMIFPIDLL